MRGPQICDDFLTALACGAGVSGINGGDCGAAAWSGANIASDSASRLGNITIMIMEDLFTSK